MRIRTVFLCIIKSLDVWIPNIEDELFIKNNLLFEMLKKG